MSSCFVCGVFMQLDGITPKLFHIKGKTCALSRMKEFFFLIYKH